MPLTHPLMPSRQQTSAALDILLVTVDTIRELGEVPSGTLYCHLMQRLSLAEYQSMMRTIKNTGLVEERNHLLVWVGPMKGQKA